MSGRASISGRGDQQSGSGSYEQVDPDATRRLPGGGSAGGGPGRPGGGLGFGRAYSGKRRPRWGRIALVGGLVLALLAGIGAAFGWWYVDDLNDKVSRTDAFAGVSNRPAKEVDGAVNILLLGSDSRDPDNGAKAGEWRTDTMIIMHISADHKKAYLISIPRDLYVHIPKSQKNPKFGNTKAKINAAFAWGGVPLVVQTLEEYTGVRLDNVVVIDFGGFQKVTDAIGGVDMNVEQDITSIHPPHRKFKKGVNHLNGAEALDYVRQRYQFAEGDFARMRHQQEFMKALMDKAVSSGTLANPSKLNAFLQSATAAITVDKDLSLMDMAMQFKDLRSNDLTFMVSPHQGSQMVGGESVVMPDKDKADKLYSAVKSDTLEEYQTQQSAPAAKPSTSTKR